MADDNDKQAEALIAALAPKIAEAIIPQITEKVEDQIQGVVKKNDELLDKIAKQKADDDHNNLMASTKRLLDAADAQQRQRQPGGWLDGVALLSTVDVALCIPAVLAEGQPAGDRQRTVERLEQQPLLRALVEQQLTRAAALWRGGFDQSGLL